MFCMSKASLLQSILTTVFLATISVGLRTLIVKLAQPLLRKKPDSNSSPWHIVVSVQGPPSPYIFLIFYLFIWHEGTFTPKFSSTWSLELKIPGTDLTTTAHLLYLQSVIMVVGQTETAAMQMAIQSPWDRLNMVSETEICWNWDLWASAWGLLRKYWTTIVQETHTRYCLQF